MKFWLFWIINVLAAPLLHPDEFESNNNELLYEGPTFEAQTHPFMFELHHEIVNHTVNEKRQLILMTSVRQAGYRLLIDFTLGTPPQKVTAEIDFFEPGLYIAQVLRGVNPMLTKAEKLSNRGVFYCDNSTTYRASPGNQLTEEKTWGQDDLCIGFQCIYRAIFYGISASRSQLGLSFLDGHHLTVDAKLETETNIFSQLKKKGLMSKYLFSLWIGGDDSDAKGMLLLGGIDFRYAMDDLYLFPLLKGFKKDPGYYIELNAITLFHEGDVGSQIIVHCTIAAHIDISISVATLPYDILLALYGELGQLGIDPIMPCELLKGYKIGFVFSGVEYLIPLLEIVTQHFNHGEDCAAPFLVGPQIALGANVLSALYMVFDVDREEIGLAFARTSKEVELGEHAVMWVKESIPATRAPAFEKGKRIRNIYEVKVRNINFATMSRQTNTPIIIKVTTTVTVTQECATSSSKARSSNRPIPPKAPKAGRVWEP